MGTAGGPAGREENNIIIPPTHCVRCRNILISRALVYMYMYTYIHVHPFRSQSPFP
jgi:hypothetical protein